jgi:hypothetical protein
MDISSENHVMGYSGQHSRICRDTISNLRPAELIELGSFKWRKRSEMEREGEEQDQSRTFHPVIPTEGKRIRLFIGAGISHRILCR